MFESTMQKIKQESPDQFNSIQKKNGKERRFTQNEQENIEKLLSLLKFYHHIQDLLLIGQGELEKESKLDSSREKLYCQY